MRALILAEALTIITYGYIGLVFAWRDLQSTARALEIAVIVVAAAIVIAGAVRRASWTPKLALVLAAFAGIPSFMSLGVLLDVYREAGLNALTMWSWITIANGAQLLALIVALKQLQVREPAA